jgi:hypothetical protein
MAGEAEDAVGLFETYEGFMSAVIDLDGKSLIADLQEARQRFPELITAFTYLSIHASAAVVAGNTFRRGNLLADCGPAVAELAVHAANAVVGAPDLAKGVMSRINAHYLQAAMEKSLEDRHVVLPTLADPSVI